LYQKYFSCNTSCIGTLKNIYIIMTSFCIYNYKRAMTHFYNIEIRKSTLKKKKKIQNLCFLFLFFCFLKKKKKKIENHCVVSLCTQMYIIKQVQLTIERDSLAPHAIIVSTNSLTGTPTNLY
jgi:hypothetical protein